MDKSTKQQFLNILCSEGYSDDLYKEILKSYLRKNTKKTENNFLIEYIEMVSEQLKFYENNNENQIKHILLENNRNEDGSIKKEIEQYIFNKKTDINGNIDNLKEQLLEFNIKLNRTHKSNENISIINFNDSKGTEKIIYLEKLGILDYLKNKEPFNLSTRALASAISGFTGIDANTVQSYINPILSKTITSQKNNPLTKDKSVNKVIQKLTSIGYNPNN